VKTSAQGQFIAQLVVRLGDNTVLVLIVDAVAQNAERLTGNFGAAVGGHIAGVAGDRAVPIDVAAVVVGIGVRITRKRSRAGAVVERAGATTTTTGIVEHRGDLNL